MEISFGVTPRSRNILKQSLCDTGRRYGALDFHKAPWEEIKARLGEVDWSDMEQADPREALKIFTEKTLNVLEKLVPTKATKSQRRPRMNRMRKLIWKRLNKVRKSMLQAPSINKLTELLQRQWELEAQLSSDYTSVGNREEDEAAMRIKENPKAFFSFARSRQKIRAKIGPFLDENGFPNPSPDFAAEALRQQYNSVFAQPRSAWTVNDFLNHFKSDDENVVGESLTDIEFGPKDIERACADLKGTAAPGPDGIPAGLLKTCRKELSKPIYLLWRSSLDGGCIPPELLLVLICPIHKGGSRSVTKNYRPVALTSHLIKVFERVVRVALVAHIDRQGLLPDGQHGSRSKRSTLTQLVSHWDNIMEGLENGDGVDCVYLDFSKAFDKVETGVLLHKLRDGRVLGKVGCWLAAFLDSKYRQQAVAVEGRVSGLSPVLSGVPQGTVLGPILFLLHIADISREVSPETRTTSYVDDTRACRCIKSIADSQALQQDLLGIYRWAEDVNMVFNSDKFECLRFWPGKTPKPDIQYLSPDNTPIEEKIHLRDLGVELCSDLSFSTHIQNLVTATTRLIGWVLRTFRRRSRMIMLTIWKTLIQSKIDYCSQLWCPTDQASIKSLESLCRQFTSQIEGLGDLDYWTRLKELKLYSQERRRERYRIIFIWKCLHGYVDGYHLNTNVSPRRGRFIELPTYAAKAPAGARQARESSLAVHGA